MRPVKTRISPGWSQSTLGVHVVLLILSCDSSFSLFLDVNIENPDKKSIMMYLMCLFKVLPHSDIRPVSESDLPLSPISPLSPESEITASVTSNLVESAKQSGVGITTKFCLILIYLNDPVFRQDRSGQTLQTLIRLSSLIKIYTAIPSAPFGHILLW